MLRGAKNKQEHRRIMLEKYGKKISSILNTTSNHLVGSFSKTDTTKEKEFRKIYGKQFTSKGLHIKKKKPVFTFHAEFRYKERFSDKFSLQEITEDLRKNWRYVKLLENGRYVVRGLLGTYIITKKFIVITMIKTGSKKQF